MRPSRILLVAGVAIVVFALDRLTKAWVSENIPLGTARPVVGEYVRIVHAQNTGAAFGLLPERTTLLSVLSVVAVLAIVYYYRQIASSSALVSATLGMQLGGAFGNLLDRVTQGYLVDRGRDHPRHRGALVRGAPRLNGDAGVVGERIALRVDEGGQRV